MDRASELTASEVAAILFDCAHGAKGENPARLTPAIFRRRLKQAVRLLVFGMRSG